MADFNLTPSPRGVALTIRGESIFIPLETCQELGQALVAVPARAGATSHLVSHQTSFLDYTKDPSFKG